MTYRAKVTAELKKIPPKKRKKKVRDTKWGVVCILLAALIAKFLPAWPWQVPVGFLAVGLLTASGEVLKNKVKWVIAAVRDLVNALKGGGDAV